MDTFTVLLLSKNVQIFGHVLVDTFIIMFSIPLLKWIYDKFLHVNWFDMYLKKKLTFNGTVSYYAGFEYFNYPLQVLAISYYCQKHKLVSDYTFQGTDISIEKNLTISTYQTIKISNSLYMTIDSGTINGTQQNSGVAPTSGVKMQMTLYSHNMDIIFDFVAKSMDEYKNSDKNLYIFTFEKVECGKPVWTKTILSSAENPNYQTFDHLFFECKDKLKTDLMQLKDLNYFAKTGDRRKKGYLFHGIGGCGKTAAVIAMALEDNRHIIEIPPDKLNPSDIGLILNFSKIPGYNVQSPAIVLFDEIDKIDMEDCSSSSEIATTESLIKKNNAKQCILSTLLSKFDGLSNYDGIVYVATANDISKLNEYIYRHGRLDPYYFGNLSFLNLRSLICHIYNLETLPEKYTKILVKASNKFTPADIAFYKKEKTIKEIMVLIEAKC